PEEQALWIDRILVGKGPRVVVGTEQNPLLPIGMPFDDQVRQFDARTVEWMAGGEPLKRNLAAELREVLLKVRLLLAHSFAAGNAGPNGANLLEITIGTFAIER